MSKTVLGPNTTVTVNATDISQFVTNVTVEDTTDEVEVTGFSETYKEYLGGLRDSTITLSVVNGYGANEPDAVITPLRTTAGTIKVKGDTAGTVVFTMVGKAYSLNPVAGGVGDANATDVTFRNASTAGLTRGTS